MCVIHKNTIKDQIHTQPYADHEAYSYMDGLHCCVLASRAYENPKRAHAEYAYVLHTRRILHLGMIQ